MQMHRNQQGTSLTAHKTTVVQVSGPITNQLDELYFLPSTACVNANRCVVWAEHRGTSKLFNWGGSSRITFVLLMLLCEITDAKCIWKYSPISHNQVGPDKKTVFINLVFKSSNRKCAPRSRLHTKNSAPSKKYSSLKLIAYFFTGQDWTTNHTLG